MKRKDVTVTAIMTAGRYENTWCRNHIELSLRELGIPLIVSGGVYYGQCMQIMLTEAVSKGVQFAITIDGDSVFTAKQLQRLISIINQEEDMIDALCALQVRRGMPTTLGTIAGVRSKQWDGYPLKVDTAHFGLTVINLAKLATVAKPWFFCQPNEYGEWTGEKIDSDVWFWKQWREAGHTIYMDPGVRIGHVEEMIAIHNEDMTVTHMYPADWVAKVKENNERSQVVEAVETVSDRPLTNVA